MNAQPEVDPYDTPEYRKFIESMARYCRCAPAFRPCDGVLAGGICDNRENEVSRDCEEAED